MVQPVFDNDSTPAPIMDSAEGAISGGEGKNGGLQDASSGAQADPKLDKRVNDTEAKLKEFQRQLHEAAVEKARIEGELNALRQSSTKEKEVGDYLHSDDWHEKFNDSFTDNPAKSFSDMLRQERKETVGFLEKTLNELKENLMGEVSMATNPERIELAEAYNELGQKAWFKALDKRAQLEAAKDWKSAQASDEVADPPRSPAGSGVSTKTPKASDARRKEEIDRVKNNIFARFDTKRKLEPTFES